MSSPPSPPAPPQQDPHVHLSSYAFLNTPEPLPLGIPISSSGDIVFFLLTHEILSTRQYMLAGLKNVKDTECSEHTALRPAVSSPVPTPPSHDIWKPILVLKIQSSKLGLAFAKQKFCSAKETYLCTSKTSFLFLLGWRHIKSQKL